MITSTISEPARKNSFAEIAQRDPSLRAMIEKNPESLLVFVRAMVTASRISRARAELLEAVTRALDTSDRVLEAIDGGFDLMFRLQAAAEALDHLGAMLADVTPTIATSGSKASN
jgi:hypothetical protein